MKSITTADTKRFVELINQGIECWIEAGKIAAEAIRKNPRFVDEVCEACPHITPETIYRFQLMGLGQLHPQLCLSEAPGVRRLRRLPFSLQEKYTSEPVEVLVRADKGYESLNVDVLNLTSEQASQVFDIHGVRSVAAQRAWLEDRAMKREAPAVRANLPYRVSGRKLVVMQPCTLERKDVVKLLAELVE